MNSYNASSHPSAFSLIEVLFAVLLLCVVLFGVIRLEVSQFRLTETRKNELQAYSLAHQRIEQVSALGKAALAACNSEKCQCKLVEAQLSCEKGTQEELGLFSHFFWVNKAGLKDAWQVTSVVEWEDGTGKHGEVEGGAAKVRRILY